MLAYILASIGYLVVVMLQFGVVSRTPLLSGTADLVMLYIIAWSLHQQSRRFWVLVLVFAVIIGAISVTPFFLSVASYMAIYYAGTRIKAQVWQTPLLAMFLLTFTGTLLLHAGYFVSAFIEGTVFDWRVVLTQITLPSVLLNMLLAIPVHAIITELVRMAYPRGVDI
jgi:cell shape-determining protein MreD